jgi:PAS domain-containing protein
MAEHKVAQQQPVEMILLRQLASYLDTPIFVVDVAARLVYYNEPAEPLLGVRFDEVGVMEPEAWLAAFRPGDEKGRVFDQGEDPLGQGAAPATSDAEPALDQRARWRATAHRYDDHAADRPRGRPSPGGGDLLARA